MNDAFKLLNFVIFPKNEKKKYVVGIKRLRLIKKDTTKIHKHTHTSTHPDTQINGLAIFLDRG